MGEAKLAVIREAECIGCTKCISACPFDAIIGSNKMMHTIINDDCSGCELCIPACPVDCIDLIPAPFQSASPDRLKHYGERIKARKQRIREEETKTPSDHHIQHKKSYIEMAIERAKEKKQTLTTA